MVDLPPQYEFRDGLGSSTPYAGTVGTTAISLPTVAGTKITEFFVRCPNQTPVSRKLLYSIDAGVTFFELSTGESIMWSLKGSVTQIQIKGSVANVSYEVFLNRDQTGEV